MPGRYASGDIMKRGTAWTLKASGAETASATHTSVETGDSGVLYVQVAVTAASGTAPTLTVVVEGSNDGTTWFVLGTVGANGYRVGSTGTAPTDLTTSATVRAAFPAMQFCRTRSVIGGTIPSFTYSIVAEAN
jgi:hypothetical protein